MAGQGTNGKKEALTLALRLRLKTGAGGVRTLNGEGSFPGLSPMIVRFDPKTAALKNPNLGPAREPAEFTLRLRLRGGG